MNKIQEALKNEELMLEVGRKATEEQVSIIDSSSQEKQETLTPEELMKKRIAELKLLQSMQAKKKNVEKYIRVMAATKDDTQRTNLGVKLTKLLKKYNQE